MRKSITLSTILVLLLSLLLSATVWAVPIIPSSFWGTVSVDSANVADGTVVSAWIDGVQYAQTSTSTWEGGSVYGPLDVPADDPDTTGVIEGGVEGDTIVFKIDGVEADQTGTWSEASSTELNLTATTASAAIVSVTPNSGEQEATLDIAIVGSNTSWDGTTVIDFGAGITVNSVSAADATHLTANITVANDATPGTRTITVTTGAEVATAVDSFTVTAAASPEISSVTPDFGLQDTTLDVAFVGSNTHWDLTSVVDFGAGITTNLINAADVTHLTANITIANDATPGFRTVTITTGGEVVTAVDGFTVTGAGSDIPVYAPADAFGTVGSQVTLPVSVASDVTGSGIYAFQFTLTFDPSVLDATGFSTAGTLSENCDVTDNHGTAGQIIVAGTCIDPLAGTGTFIDLAFDVGNPGGAETDLVFASFAFNEGDPAATMSNGHFTIGSLSVAGHTSYYTNAVPVPDVTVILVGPAGGSGVTDGDGNYVVEVTTPGDYTATPAKSGDAVDAISGLDAAWIKQYAVLLRTFDADQLRVCDVTGNGDCSAYDAALIARSVVGLLDPPSSAGQWQFEPATRSYQPLSTNLADENYTAYLMGDVTGNWTSAVPPAPAQAVHGDSVLVRLPTAFILPGHAISVPIQIDEVTGQGILAYQLSLVYDPAVLVLQEVIQEGSLSAGWSVEMNSTQPGQVGIVGYGAGALQGAGDLLYVTFKAVGVAGDHSTLLFETLRLNEGQPTAQAVDGLVQVNTPLFLPLLTR